MSALDRTFCIIWIFLCIVFVVTPTEKLMELIPQKFTPGDKNMLDCPILEVTTPDNSLTPEYTSSAEFFGAARAPRKPLPRASHAIVETMGCSEKMMNRKMKTIRGSKRVVWK